MAHWLTTPDDDETIFALWPDAEDIPTPILSMHLAAARDECEAYAPTLPGSGPHTVTVTAGNATAVLTREGNTVRAVVSGVDDDSGSEFALPIGYRSQVEIDVMNPANNGWLTIGLDYDLTPPAGTVLSATWRVGDGETIFYPTIDPAVGTVIIPDGWALAQVMQARNKYNADLASAGSGDLDSGSFGITAHPLDWQIKQLLRPQRGMGAIV